MATKLVPHPKSAPGDFYVVKGECLACGFPHVLAPDLIGWADEKIPHCVWKKQPSNDNEMDAAISVLELQELECHRYAGTDPAILSRIASNLCDHATEGSASAPSHTAAGQSPNVRIFEPRSLVAGLWNKIRAIFR